MSRINALIHLNKFHNSNSFREFCSSLKESIYQTTRKCIVYDANDGYIVNVPEYPIAFLGSIESGLKVTTVNPSYSPREMAHQLSDCEVKAVFCDVSNYACVKQSCELAQLHGVKIIVLNDGSQSIPSTAIHFHELINTTGLILSESSKFNDNANLDDVVVLPYSSGTTGLPKGVMHSHKTFIANSEQLSTNMFTQPNTLPTTNDFQDVLPCFLPFYHIYALNIVLQNRLSLGSKIVSMRKYNADHYLDLLRKHRATILTVVPPVIIQLGHHLAAKPSHFDSVRLMFCGASSLSQDDAARLLNKAPASKFIQAYGMTEGFATCATQDIADHQTVGWPISNVEVKIAGVDDNHFKGQPSNKSGEILFKGPNIMKGYFKNNKATANTITADGWLRSGDIGYYDDNGALFVIDRLKELIKVNALQVAPAELESLLRNHPDILEAAVVGIPHPTSGEIPKAFVIRRPDSKTGENEIKDYIAQHVSKYKQLKGGVQFIDNIPKSASGKILRREIKRLYL